MQHGTNNYPIPVTSTTDGTYDFLYALLDVWDAPELATMLRLILLAVDEKALPARSDEGDMKFWQHGRLPVMLPHPDTPPCATGLSQLCDILEHQSRHPLATSSSVSIPDANVDGGEEDNDDNDDDDASKKEDSFNRGLVAESARIAVLLMFAYDFRVARLIMIPSEQTHSVMFTRPPNQRRVFHFLHTLGARDALLSYAADINGLLHERGTDPDTITMCHRLTLDIMFFIRALWITQSHPSISREELMETLQHEQHQTYENSVRGIPISNDENTTHETRAWHPRFFFF